MWPWEHLAFGYLWYSAYSRLVGRTGPDSTGVVLVAFGSLFPDLVDKPLAWGLGVLPAGRSLAHSLLVVGPLLVVAVSLGRGVVRRRTVAFAVAYLSHLVGDVVYPLVTDGRLVLGFLVWPLVPAPHGHGGGDFLGRVSELSAAFAGFVSTPRGLTYLTVELVAVGVIVLLYAYDGFPGLDRFIGAFRR